MAVIKEHRSRGRFHGVMARRRTAGPRPSKTIRGIEHMDILETGATVGDGTISEYHTHVRISFRLER